MTPAVLSNVPAVLNVQEHITNTIQKLTISKKTAKAVAKLWFAFKTIYMFHTMYTILNCGKERLQIAITQL